MEAGSGPIAQIRSSRIVGIMCLCECLILRRTLQDSLLVWQDQATHSATMKTALGFAGFLGGGGVGAARESHWEWKEQLEQVSHGLTLISPRVDLIRSDRNPQEEGMWLAAVAAHDGIESIGIPLARNAMEMRSRD